MSDIKLGQLAGENALRDAVHVAIAPLVAGQSLEPGQHVKLNTDGEAVGGAPFIGIVDPFLVNDVEKGERFWLCLYQQTVTGMRHCWSHPAFPVTDKLDAKGEAEAWLRSAADIAGVSFERMMSYVEYDDYINMGENERFKDIDYGLFQKHVQTLTGKENASPPFSCSC